MAVEVKQLGLSALAPAVISASDDMLEGEVVRDLDVYINIMWSRLTVQKKLSGTRNVSSTSSGFILRRSGEVFFIRPTKGVMTAP